MYERGLLRFMDGFSLPSAPMGRYDASTRRSTIDGEKHYFKTWNNEGRYWTDLKFSSYPPAHCQQVCCSPLTLLSVSATLFSNTKIINQVKESSRDRKVRCTVNLSSCVFPHFARSVGAGPCIINYVNMA